MTINQVLESSYTTNDIKKSSETPSTMGMRGKLGCPQSSSTGDNSCMNTHNSEQNTIIMLGEMRTIMGLPALEIVQLTNTEKIMEDFYTDFENRYIDKSYLIHAKYVINAVKMISKERYKQNDFFELLTDSDFLTIVLKELQKTKSYEKRKTLLKRLCSFYFSKLNLHKLNTERNRCLNLLNYYGKKSNHKITPDAKLHLRVEEFINYLTQTLDQKWQKKARLDITDFLKWLVETNAVVEDNLLEINVRQIKPESLKEYRNFLLLRMELKQITAGTAQLKLRSIRRWFEFLKLRKYISLNPCNQLDNIKVEVKEKGELLPVETVKRFFQVVWEDEDALKWLSLFMLLATDGLRSVEVLNLKRSNFFPTRNQIKITRKGGNKQVIPITGLTSLLIELYLQSCPVDVDTKIWMNSIGTPLNYDSLYNAFDKFKRKAGIETIGATHFFRRLLFSELAYQTMDLDRIRKLAGHKSIKHLDAYLHLKKAQLRNNVAKMLPTMGVEFYDYGN